VPCPCGPTHFDAAAERAISLRTTSMPMPRPEICVTFDAVEKPGWNRHSTAAARCGVPRRAPDPRASALAHAREVDAAPSSASSISTFVADLATVRAISPVSACRPRARVARLDAVVERVAQQVLERAHELLQHRAVELELRAVDLEVRALVELLARWCA
jgi:hypothetical protein